jgi:hypothetical protein
MNGWPGHGIRTLVLALVLALGMSLSVVQGGLMAAEMAVAADGADHGAGGCDGCGGGDHQGMDAGTCLTVCGTTAQGLMPGELLTLPSGSGTSLQVARPHLSSQFHSPEHGPPKLLTLS